MKNNKFVHVHLHTTNSLLDGMGTAEQYVNRAKELGFEYLAITNHGNVDGCLKFQIACDKHGIKPILGVEAYIVEDATIKNAQLEHKGDIVLFAKNLEGWQNICKMLSYANLTGFYSKPRIDYKILLENCEGVCISTACARTFLNQKNGMDLLLALTKKIPKEDIYLEIQPHNFPAQIELNKELVRLSKEPELALIAGNDCHYIMPEDSETHEILLAIQTKKTIKDSSRWKFSTNGFHLRTADEMIEAFEAQNALDAEIYIGAMRETISLAEKCCDFRIPKQPIDLPHIENVVTEQDEEDLMRQKCEKGAKKHFGGMLNEEYQNRFDYEFDLLKRKGFVRYLLLVSNLVDWCKENSIMVGPGRGSVGCSLIAYLMGITNIDPIEYDLPFARFVAEDRVDAPDIDLDYSDNQRHLVQQHLKDLYGENNIAGIATFLKMDSKAVLHDVSRVFEIPDSEVMEFTKTIDKQDSLKDALEKETVGEKTKEKRFVGKLFAEKYPDVIKHSLRLEGQIKSSGRHAAGLIISNEDLRTGTRGVLTKRGSKDDETIVVNWDGSDCEYVGLMKLDVLGLKTLSVLSECKRLIEKNKEKKILWHEASQCMFVGTEEDINPEVDEISLNFERIPLNDPEVLKDLSEGKTTGVFQLLTPAMTKLCKQMGIDSFENISDAVALVRPGPHESGMTDLFIERKKGAEWEKKHFLYEDLTKKTYGTLIYQEDIMNVINKVAGLPYSTADKIRKILAKKRDAKELEPYKKQIEDGCARLGTMNSEEVEEFWDMLNKSARYLFNRSHSCLYGMISMWTAWLKHYFPIEYLSAFLSYGSASNRDKVIKEIKRLGFKIVPPKIGFSEAKIWNVIDNKLYVPFNQIKGIGDEISETIANSSKKTQSRKGGFFSKLAKPVPEITGKVRELLDKVGAFDTTSDDVPSDCESLFDFDLSSDSIHTYPRLKLLVGDNTGLAVKNLVEGKVKGLKLAKAAIDYDLMPWECLSDCKGCELRKYSKTPLMPSEGEINAMILSDFPDSVENEEGKILVSSASKKVLWPELRKYDLERTTFHLSSVCKCYPGEKVKAPKLSHIDKCLELHLSREIDMIKPFAILALGALSLYALTGKEKGISNLSGVTEWSEKWGCWICYCVHPNSVLRNPSNRRKFESGIKNFSDVISNIGGL